jgi:hypothetical protein
MSMEGGIMANDKTGAAEGVPEVVPQQVTPETEPEITSGGGVGFPR